MKLYSAFGAKSQHGARGVLGPAPSFRPSMGCPERLQQLDLVHHSNVCPQNSLRKPGGPCYLRHLACTFSKSPSGWGFDTTVRAVAKPTASFSPTATGDLYLLRGLTAGRTDPPRPVRAPEEPAGEGMGEQDNQFLLCRGGVRSRIPKSLPYYH